MAVPSIPLFSRLYRYLEGRRRLLWGVTLLVVALATLLSWRLRIQEDIAAMLPDDGSSVAQDFDLLQLAPFTRKVVITLKGAEGVDTAILTGAADALAAAIQGPGIAKVMTGPDGNAGRMFQWLGRALPNLTTPADISRLEGMTTPAEVQKRLRESYEALLSPEGWALKGRVQSDPLSFSALALEKMRFLSMVPQLRLVNNHFVSADGKSALVMAESTSSMTDSAGARELLRRIETAMATLPKGVSATVVCGHRYTLANADTIKRDLQLILTINTVAVLAIYFFFLRSLSAVFVFLVPASILVLASGVMACMGNTVYALTLGFGGVLLGIADEYAMLVYFSCRRGGKDVATITAEVARPVLFGAAGTLLSFGVMLFSTLPGQRQLAVYSMTGIIASVVLSLVVLPHLVKGAPHVAQGRALPADSPSRLPRRLVIFVWIGVLVFCGWNATKVRFNGDLHAIGMVTPELRQAEAEVAKTWGDLRGKALLFAEGRDLETALAVNERLFQRLSHRFRPGDLVSLAPLMPSGKMQAQNRERWLSFWNGGRSERLAADLGKEGATLGFSPDAFGSFLATLRLPAAPAGVESLRDAGLEELSASLIVRSPGTVRVLTMVPDTPEALRTLEGELKEVPGVHLVSQSRFASQISGAIVDDFLRYLSVTSVLVLALVAAIFRRPQRIALVLVPVATGVICMLGMMGALGIEFNIFNIAATVLIIGLCVDYGIFTVCRLTEGTNHAASRAVLVSGLTTLAGLGSLALARHPSMHSIGITVLLGVGSGIPAALLVIPALIGKERA